MHSFYHYLTKDATRFQLDLVEPKLEFFTASDSHVPYRGPQDLLGLTTFIDEQMQGTVTSKVLNHN